MSLLLTKTCEYAILITIQQGKTHEIALLLFLIKKNR
jgi:hypothetical protein